MHLINFFSEKKTFKINNKKKLRLLFKEVCKQEKAVLSFVNCVFCSDEYLLKINKKHLKHNFLTDIITFDFSEKKNQIEGDLYISVDRVKDNAKKYKDTFLDETTRVVLHGLLHLIGYNDKTEKEKKRMRVLENKYVSLYKKL
jgi:rRNA maturation RNase YbeY|tara:strand:+ start:13803 stop:14231 length:429 start_codon:yes stop_codon:yes gene_type:complete